MKAVATQNKKRVYFDLDGTLAEWRQTATPEDLIKDGYYLNLAPTSLTPYADKLAEEGEPFAEVSILSSYLDNGYALKDKKEWCDRHVPAIDDGHRIFVPYGFNKAEYVMSQLNRPLTRDDVLVDDHTKNCQEWEDAGGRAIKWLNGINGNNGVFKGTRVMWTCDLASAIFA